MGLSGRFQGFHSVRISKTTIEELENSEPPIRYILGVRMRNLKEAKERVMGDEGA